jgi:hypothetical protein
LFRQTHSLRPQVGRSKIQTAECREEPIPNYIEKYKAELRGPTETWVAQQKFSKTEIQELVQEAERQMEMFTIQENALVAEIDKVQKDIEAYEEVKIWYGKESVAREVTLQDVRDKFNDLRWGGKGVKVGGIDTNADGAAVISDEFRKANPEVIVQGYVLHEQVHQKHFKEMNVVSAGFRSIVNGLKHGKPFGQTWAAGQKIDSEFEAHRVQKEFYENCLSGVRSERSPSERLIKALRAKKMSTSP